LPEKTNGHESWEGLASWEAGWVLAGTGEDQVNVTSTCS